MYPSDDESVGVDVDVEPGATRSFNRRVVAHGNAFGAERLVDLGGRPHCSLYTGTDYMKPMIDLFQECGAAPRIVWPGLSEFEWPAVG